MLIRHAALVAVATLCATGCGIKEDVPYKVKMLFESEVDKCATETKTVDLSTDKSFAENKQYMKEIAVKDITIAITNPNVNGKNEATQSDGAAAGAKAGSTETFILGTYQPIQIEAGSTQSMTVDPSSQAKISEIILGSDSKFDVQGSACADKVPYSFEAEFTINFEITAGAF